MSQISLVGRSQASGAAREAFERKVAERGNIPNMYRVFAHRPWLLSTMDAHFAAVMGSGTVPVKLKELLALQTSLENACRYCAASHTVLAERTGATKEQVAAARFEGGPYTTEKAALRFGSDDPRLQPIPDHFAALAPLRRGRDRRDRRVVGLFAYFNRFNDASARAHAPGEGVDT